MGEQPITSERLILRDYLEKSRDFPTQVKELLSPDYENPVKEAELGIYRDRQNRKCVTADLEVIEEIVKMGRPIPGFLEAGPRAKLAFEEPQRSDEGLKVAVVTTGGLAPGLNSVLHTIVGRHLMTYRKLVGNEGGVWGFRNSFKGLIDNEPNWIQLDTKITKEWSEKGGTELGAVRYKELDLEELSKRIAGNLARWEVRILYVIGGDGSLTAAHAIAEKTKETIVVGIPKTMDNDILWAWQSFGFNSAVERAAAFISTMHCEVMSTRRVAILEFFGARSGFVAANAALASGHVDLVMIPEVFESMTKKEALRILSLYSDYLDTTIKRKKKLPHAVIVIAEGVGEVLSDLGVIPPGEAGKFAESFKTSLNLQAMSGEEIAAFSVRPRYYIRAIPANSHDQVYCKRLAALAVDNALAGFTDFMISQWLTEYVLVPLELVAGGQKHVPPSGIFWKQVVASTGQPTTSH
jgi:6-phosphofructokinase 1